MKHCTGKDMLIYVQQAHGRQGSYKQRQKEAKHGVWTLYLGMIGEGKCLSQMQCEKGIPPTKNNRARYLPFGLTQFFSFPDVKLTRNLKCPVVCGNEYIKKRTKKKLTNKIAVQISFREECNCTDLK